MDSIACTSRKCGQPIIEKSDPCRNKLSIASSSFPNLRSRGSVGQGCKQWKIKEKAGPKI